MKILFIEPPKQPWFIMGEYMPPPFALLCLAAYLEVHHDDVEIQVMDCQAEEATWSDVEHRIDSFHPDIVAPSTVSTCNADLVIRVASIAKNLDRTITTLAGNQHFTALAQETLDAFPQLDIVIRGEGEVTLVALVQALEKNRPLSQVKGISFRKNGEVKHTPNRPLIENLDTLPFPGYHFVRDHMKKYNFPVGKNLPYALIEGGRGCDHTCTFCGQWRYWGSCRKKSPQRVADEFEYVYREFGSRFLWLTDDYVRLDEWMNTLCDEIINRGITEDLMWFFQARADDIILGKELLPKLRETGVQWIFSGLERHDPQTLAKYRKHIDVSMGKEAIRLLKEHGILAQTSAIIGDRHDSKESIEAFRNWIDDVNPDIAVFMIMTPFPGTPLYKEALQNEWLEDSQWADFDMIHATLPTEHLTRREAQQELFKCYRTFYRWKRRVGGVFARNKIKRSYFRHFMRKGFLTTLKGIFGL